MRPGGNHTTWKQLRTFTSCLSKKTNIPQKMLKLSINQFHIAWIWNAGCCHLCWASASHVLNQPALKGVSWYWQKKKRGFDNTAAELLLFYSQTQMYEHNWDHIILYTYYDTLVGCLLCEGPSYPNAQMKASACRTGIKIYLSFVLTTRKDQQVS